MFQKLLFTLLIIFWSSFSLLAQDLINVQWIGSQTKETLNTQFGLAFFSYDVDHYKVEYTSLDVAGQLDTVSGLLTIPEGPDKIFPMLCYQHGTVGAKEDVPSNLEGGFQLAEIWGALGYITFAPDFLGLGEGRGFHPYVHAASEAWVAIDMMSAVKTYLDDNEYFYNDQLFVTGYSQGGHAAAALHKEIEENYSDQITVTASAPMSGPYSISGVMNDFMVAEIPYGFVGYLPYTLLSYETVYGNIYDELSDIFKPNYVQDIENFYTGQIDLWDLNQSLINKLIQDFGDSYPSKLLKDDVVDDVLNDPDHPMNVALRDNDVFEWAPQAPTRLYYCEGDEQVPFMNSVVADSVMNMLGAIDTQAENLDFNAELDHFNSVQPAMLNAMIFFAGYAQIDDSSNTFSPDLNDKFSIFPNPAVDLFFLENKNDGGLLQLIDLTGKVLLEQNLVSGTNEIRVNGLTSGVYLVKVNFAGQFFTKKLFVR